MCYAAAFLNVNIVHMYINIKSKAMASSFEPSDIWTRFYEGRRPREGDRAKEEAGVVGVREELTCCDHIDGQFSLCRPFLNSNICRRRQIW